MVGDVLVVVVLPPCLTGVEPITHPVVIVAVEPLLPESEAVPGGEEFATLDAAEALKMSFPFRATLQHSASAWNYLKKSQFLSSNSELK